MAAPIPLELAALHMGSAVLLGALIGSERQVRQRMAGLRTNALVALGAAAFVIFASLIPNDASPTRVAAQVVSGIGFLGAGIIFRDGFNVHGLNTAATLWCSAAVGLLAGAGFLSYAATTAGLVVFINLGLRPLVKWLKRHTAAGTPILRQYRVEVQADSSAEAQARALLVGTLGAGGMHLVELDSRAEGEAIGLTALVNASGLTEDAVEQAFRRLLLDSGLSRVRWVALDE
jgi:putative Mg2+ transporter-C (MgtC) family protein